MSGADVTIAEGLATSETLVAGDGGDTRGSAPNIDRGVQIGRYLVLGKLGAGAMGVVLAAYDPELDRKVAIKLLKPRDGDQAAARTRLQREAQALARLDHPHVVGVHDVGIHGEQLFVAMDFVAGQTLGTWMGRGADSRPRPWPEVVRNFAEAGRGLAAAHEAGLIHRDFKPENVMVGDDGRVRVMDFGLARTHANSRCGADQQERPSEVDLGSVQKQLLGSSLTGSGALVGTLAYMAPEVFHGQLADTRSDQFSFCVSLFEALYSRRPFASDSLAQLIESLKSGQIQPAPRGSRVPTWLHKAVVRGLASDPARRWPSMTALVDALLDDPSVRRRKWWIAVGMLGLLGGSIFGLVEWMRHAQRICEGMEDRLAGVWDSSRRADVEQALLATRLGYAGETWSRVEQHLDDYAGAWVAARKEACLANQRGEQSDTLLDLRMACLDQRLDHLRALVHELSTADSRVVEKAVQAVMTLPNLDRCADPDALLAEVPPPDDPAVAEQVRALEARLIEATAKQSAGRYEESLALINAVVAEASTLDYQPLLTRVLLRQGELLHLAGDYPAAVAAFERAYEIAVAHRMTGEAASAASFLMYTYGYELSRPEDGRRWAVHAEPLSRAARTNEARISYLASASALAEMVGELAEARKYQQQVVELRDAEWGPEHPDTATALSNLGLIADLQGEYDEARRYYERALAIYEQALGPEHPRLASALNGLGTVAYAQGRLDDAQQRFQQSLEIAEMALGQSHPMTGSALENLGSVAFARADYAAAREYRNRSLRIVIETRGPEHPQVANALNNLGNIAWEEGNNAEARDFHERALAIREKTQGPDHPHVAGTLGSLGSVALDEGDLAASRDYFERSLAIYDRSLGLDHPHVAFSLTGLGRALIAAGEPDQAIAQLERALAIRTANEVDPNFLAETRFVLARALWDAPNGQGRDRARAVELAEAARATWANDDSWRSNHRDVVAWLAARTEGR